MSDHPSPIEEVIWGHWREEEASGGDLGGAGRGWRALFPAGGGACSLLRGQFTEYSLRAHSGQTMECLGGVPSPSPSNPPADPLSAPRWPQAIQITQMSHFPIKSIIDTKEEGKNLPPTRYILADILDGAAGGKRGQNEARGAGEGRGSGSRYSGLSPHSPHLPGFTPSPFVCTGGGILPPNES